jgi:hypothetical protein
VHTLDYFAYSQNFTNSLETTCRTCTRRAPFSALQKIRAAGGKPVLAISRIAMPAEVKPRSSRVRAISSA